MKADQDGKLETLRLAGEGWKVEGGGFRAVGLEIEAGGGLDLA